MTYEEIATHVGVSVRQVYRGVRDASRERDGGPEENQEHANLNDGELASLRKLVRTRTVYQTPEVLDWLANQRADRRRAGRDRGPSD